MSAVNSSAAAASQRMGLSPSDLARAPPGNRSLNSAMAAQVLNEMAVTTKSKLASWSRPSKIAGFPTRVPAPRGCHR